MTLDEFFTTLAKTKEIINWKKLEDGRIRGYKILGEPNCFCPLSAVCYQEKHKYIPHHMFFSLVSELAIDFFSARQVVYGSDTENTYPVMRRLLEEVLL